MYNDYISTQINDYSRKIINIERKPLKEYTNKIENNYSNPNVNDMYYVQKIMFENNYSFDYDYDYLYYDIEAVANNHDFPNKENNTAFVTSIQFHHNNKTTIYTLSIYFQLFREQENINYIYFDNSATMCQEFIMYLHRLTKYTLVIGFNTSSEVFSKLEYADRNTVYGYDLSFIVHQSGFRNLTPLNGKGMKAIQTVAFYELPNVLFVDLFVLLKREVEVVASVK